MVLCGRCVVVMYIASYIITMFQYNHYWTNFTADCTAIDFVLVMVIDQSE